jgi:hypothetical protein
MMNFMVNILLFQASLFQQFVRYALAQIGLGVRDADVPRLVRVRVNVMAAFAPSLSPSGTFEHLDEHFAVHGGYCIHRI